MLEVEMGYTRQSLCGTPVDQSTIQNRNLDSREIKSGREVYDLRESLRGDCKTLQSGESIQDVIKREAIQRRMDSEMFDVPANGVLLDLLIEVSVGVVCWIGEVGDEALERFRHCFVED